MKTRFDPRHQKRIKLMQALFAWEVDNSQEITDISKDCIQSLDNQIIKYASKWPLDQINKIDLAVLRLALWELDNKPEVPQKVVLDEAIEIAKEFGNEHSAAFVNGVLASYIKDHV